MVRSYVTGPGRPSILDAVARTEEAFSFATAKRRAFQRAWYATVDEIVADRRRSPSGRDQYDLLDLLLAARDSKTGAALSPAEVRDQCATMIFGWLRDNGAPAVLGVLPVDARPGGARAPADRDQSICPGSRGRAR
jgi:hypothetical protein